MKIRTGFVSNSSSSSFVIMLTKEESDNIRNELSDAEKLVFDYMSDNSAKEKFGLVSFVGYSNDDYSIYQELSDNIELPDDIGMGAIDIWEKIERKIPKDAPKINTYF